MGGLAKALTEDQELVRVMEKVCDRVWKDWYLSAPENWNEIYGDAFDWTPQETIPNGKNPQESLLMAKHNYRTGNP